MSNLKIFFPLVFLALVFFGCGGGGSDGGGGNGFTGTYDVNSIKMEDNCNAFPHTNNTYVQNVTQSGNDITLVSNVYTLHGNIVTDNLGYGFNVTTQEIENNCVITIATVYRESQTPNTYNYGSSIIARCPNEPECRLSFGGQAVKR
jgi:hypothetical protein